MKKLIISAIIILFLLNSTFSAMSETSFNNENNLNNNSDITRCEGYTLLSVHAKYSRVILIDMNGKVIRRWWHLFPFPAKILPEGNIISAKKSDEPSSHSESDMSEIIQEDWNGNVLWNFTNWDLNEARQHHDFQREGNPVGYYAPDQNFVLNGKTLILAHKNIINDNISDKELIDDVIYEVDWAGDLTGFEWYASEHFDEFGFSEEAKQAIRGYPGCNCTIERMEEGDWLHINSISLIGQNHWYESDPEKYWYLKPENIILNSRHANFIAIISRDNGSVVWRVGPYFSEYSKNENTLSQIIGTHNAHMIPKNLPGEGNILVFDNGGEAGYDNKECPCIFRGFSRVIEFNPVTKKVVWEYKNSYGRHITLFLKILWLLIPKGKMHHFYSSYVSSAQRLPNGNTMITEGMVGRVFEVTNMGKIVWEYNLPPWLPILNYKNRLVYRAYRIPPEWVPGNPSGYQYWEY